MRQLLRLRPNLDDLPAPPPLPSTYVLRPARSDDAEGIAAVLASAFGPRWTADRVREELLDAPDVDRVFPVAVSGTPVATASARLMPDLYPGSGYLHWVGVQADHRGHRLGAVVSLAVLETDPERLAAIRIYLRLGFRPEPVAPEHPAAWRAVLASLAAPTIS